MVLTTHEQIMSKYHTKPGEHEGMPPGVPHIIGNEAAERFSFYGMKGILVVFMAQYLHLMNETPGSAMEETTASANYHFFNFWVYITPLVGAFISDLFLGKYRTIITLSLVYVAGHAALAFMGVTGDAKLWLFAGLALIAIGSGGIKPCVSAHVGDQFGTSNAHLLPKIFNWFYFSINLGAMVSMLLTPWLLEWYGPHWAFGVPGVLMALATLVFWMGRKRFVHIPAGGRQTMRELTSPEGLSAIGRILPLFLFVSVFWALFDQTGSTWIFQSQDMDRQFLGREWLPSQIQSVNSLLVLTLIPIFTYLVYPQVSKVWPLTPLRKIGMGLFVMAAAFVLVALVQTWIDGGARPNIGWQLTAYVFLTASEVMVSIVALEFAYTQAPKTIKSIVMSLFLGAVALGNIFTAGVNYIIRIDSPTEQLAERVNEENLQKVHPGYDGQQGTLDDLTVGEEGTSSAGSQQIEGLLQRFAKQENSFPSDEEGNRLLAAAKDPWGSPFRYKLLNSRTARIASAGPDKEEKTQWDQGVVLTLPEPERKKEKSWSDRFVPSEPWLEKRKRELGLAGKEEDASAEGESYPFKVESFAGGGTRLEGAAYFWFFAGLMLVTALIFIPYALKYRGKTILQD